MKLQKNFFSSLFQKLYFAIEKKKREKNLKKVLTFKNQNVQFMQMFNFFEIKTLFFFSN